MSNIDVYYENNQFESDYLPLISFKTQQQQEQAEKYILDKVKIFFEQIIKIDIDVTQSHISYSKTITEKDFNKKEIKYFYENILYDIGKRDTKGKLSFSPKWGITFDEKCTPVLISRLSSRYRVYSDSKPSYSKFIYDNIIPYFRYGTIDINDTPIFYYIYFTLQELLDVMK